MTDIDISKLQAILTQADRSAMNLFELEKILRDKYDEVNDLCMRKYELLSGYSGLSDQIQTSYNRLQGDNDISTQQMKHLELSNRVDNIVARLQELQRLYDINKYNIGFVSGLNDQEINLNGVYCVAINHPDATIGAKSSLDATLNLLTSLTDDEGRPLLKSENILRFNGSTNKTLFMKDISDQIDKVPPNGLLFFIYSGHGGGYLYSGDFQGRHQYIAVNTTYDYEVWDLFKKCRGRVFALFDCCYSGTMYGYQVRGVDEQQGQQILPFGSNWCYEDNIESIRIGNEDKQARVIYNAGDMNTISGKNWKSYYTAGNPVFVKLNTTDVRMCAFSGSPEQSYGWSSRGNMTFQASLRKAINSSKGSTNIVSETYSDIFSSTYNDHYRASVSYGDGKYIRASLCTFTDGFDPRTIKFFR